MLLMPSFPPFPLARHRPAEPRWHGPSSAGLATLLWRTHSRHRFAEGWY